MTSGYQKENRREEWRSSNDSSEEFSHEHVSGLSLTVLFTTVSGTLAALREATHWADKLGARTRVLVAQIVPYPLPLDKPRVDPEFRLRSFRAVCEQVPIETCIEVQLCRDACQCFREALLPHSLVLIGGHLPWWPLTWEKRLARRLQRSGHQVLLVCPCRKRRGS